MVCFLLLSCPLVRVNLAFLLINIREHNLPHMQQLWLFSHREEGLIVAVIDLLIGKVLNRQITGLLFARIIIAG